MSEVSQIMQENRELRLRLMEAEEALNAIRNAEVDAIVVNGREGQKIFSLSSAETPYRILIEKMGEGAVTLTAKGVILYANPKFVSMTGITGEDVIGRKIFDFVVKSDLKRFRIFLENVLRDEGKEDEFRMNDSSNGERYCRFSMNKLPPEMTGDLFIIVTDVTERKNFDRIMISKTFEIEEMEKAKLASDLHDDMGPTLSAIKMQLTLLSSERPNEILTSCDEMLNDCISRMRSLANNISPKAVETYGLEAALSSFIEKIEKGQQIQFNFSSNLADNRFPREIEIHLYRVLTELITNTIKHVGKARVTIDLKLHDAVIEVFYADNGPGYSVENKPTASSGSGLLNIKSRVSIMNGRIDFINRDGHTGVMITVDFSK